MLLVRGGRWFPKWAESGWRIAAAKTPALAIGSQRRLPRHPLPASKLPPPPRTPSTWADIPPGTQGRGGRNLPQRPPRLALHGLIDPPQRQRDPDVSRHQAEVLQLRAQVSAEGEHARSQNAWQFCQSFPAQPQVAQKESEPDVCDQQILHGLVGQAFAQAIESEHEPRRRIEQRRLDVAHETHPAVDGWIPQGKMALPQALECVVRQRVMKPAQMVRNMDPPYRRNVLEKE